MVLNVVGIVYSQCTASKFFHCGLEKIFGLENNPISSFKVLKKTIFLEKVVLIAATTLSLSLTYLLKNYCFEKPFFKSFRCFNDNEIILASLITCLFYGFFLYKIPSGEAVIHEIVRQINHNLQEAKESPKYKHNLIKLDKNKRPKAMIESINIINQREKKPLSDAAKDCDLHIIYNFSLTEENDSFFYSFRYANSQHEFKINHHCVFSKLRENAWLGINLNSHYQVTDILEIQNSEYLTLNCNNFKKFN